ncbi:cation:proton antiporter [Brevundimonas sp.]|uniref:cation:proton antiporter n=1 Tax=Brevundimonas sp. TaxID=1871086 RepID=UPI0035B11AFC
MHHLALVLAAIGVLGIGAQWIAWRTGWPAIALMLIAGILAGPVTGFIQPERDFGPMLEPLISLAVAIILFEGGLNLNFRELRHAEGAVHRLALLGVPIAWGLGALACYYVAGLVWPVAILFAGILVVTGPTVILPLLRQTNLAHRPRAILKWESIVNDPLGALCAVVTYEILHRTAQGDSVAGVAVSLLLASIVAGLLGWGAARLIAWAFPRGHVPEFLKAPVLLIAVIGVFVGANMIQEESGLLTVTVMGVALANMRLASFRDLMPFKENITVLLVSGVFVMLSASLNLEVLRQFEWRFLAFLAVLLFLVRPATVLLSLAGSRVPIREQLFIGWIAPRGIVAVAISGLFALKMGDLGYEDGGVLVSLSFAVVIATIFAHGFTAKLAARWLGVTGDTKKGVLIVGTTPWSLALAEALRELEMPVVVADTSWQRLARARQRDIPTYHGEILAEATEDHLDMGRFQALVAATDNEAYNALVCNELATEVGRHAVYQLGDVDHDDARALPAALRGRTLFPSGLGVEEIDQRLRQGWTLRKTRLTEQFSLKDAMRELPEGADQLMVIGKSGKIHFFSHASRPKPEAGDTVVSYAPPKPGAVRSETVESATSTQGDEDMTASPALP